MMPYVYATLACLVVAFAIATLTVALPIAEAVAVVSLISAVLALETP